jgi:hypothetical protein
MATPLDQALREALAARQARAARGDLVRTGQALVTLRNPEGLHLVYRLRKREAWVDRRGVERPAEGYWLDCREAGHDWVAVGIASQNGTISRTARSTDDRAIRYGAAILLRALVEDTRTITTAAGRVYTLHVEDRCARCGEELTDPLSIEDGIGPTCYRNEHGHPRPTLRQREAAAKATSA